MELMFSGPLSIKQAEESNTPGPTVHFGSHAQMNINFNCRNLSLVEAKKREKF